MSAHDLPTEDAARRPAVNGSGKKARPFAAIDNPSLSPSYDTSLSPSPVPDWALVREDPSDQPDYMPRGRAAHAGGARAVLAPTIGPGSAPAPSMLPSNDLQDLDSFFLEGGEGLRNEHSSRTRDWLPDDFDDPMEVSPKKRRVERVVNNDIDEALDFPMPMPLPLELDLDHATVEVGAGNGNDVYPSDLHHDIHIGVHGDINDDLHPDMHPDMHPDLSFSYHEEEELHLHPMPMQRGHPRAAVMANRINPHLHPSMHHPHGYLHELDMFPVEHAPVRHIRRSQHARSPSSSPHVSPSQMQPRRVATMGRHAPRPATYSGRYMNAYVPAVPAAMGSSPVYYRRVYAHPQQYRYMNAASLPSARMRKAYHLPPVSSDRQVGQNGPYYMCPDDEPFHRHAFFPSGPNGACADELLLMDDRSHSSVAAMDMALQQETEQLDRNPEMKRRPGPPTLKYGSPDPCAKTAPPDPMHDGKPSPDQRALKLVVTPASVCVAASVPPLPLTSVSEREECKDDEVVVHFSKREHTSLAIDEDANWLSEFQSYVRLEFLEIFRANLEDVKFRNTSRKVAHKQLGIRCRFCAHVHPGSRARRSSAYPSSTAQIYQSFNMMIRDHFPRCEHVPKSSMEMFHKLKGRNNQGAADSKHFWSYAAEKIGMVDSDTGIYMDEATQRAALSKAPFSTTESILAAARDPPVFLVTPDDRALISPFMFELMSRVQRVNLLEIECRSTRKNLKVGLPGFGCRYCCTASRLGFSRIFPTKRKGLPEKANDLYEHMRRCTLCPPEVKKRLQSIRPKPEEVNSSTEKVFFDRVWARLNAGA